MIIVDFNHNVISSIHASLHKTDGKLEPAFVRHLVLRRMQILNSKYKKSFGQLVISVDSGNNWRKNIFPEYKANRKKGREESSLDWNLIYHLIETLSDDLLEVFGVPKIRLDTYESDDIIASLVRSRPDEKHIIISTDKDFQQLRRFSNIEQWDANKDRFVALDKDETLKDYIITHILKGDVGDGVPNFWSYDSQLVDGVRQTPISKKLISSISAKVDMNTIFDDTKNFIQIILDDEMVQKKIEEKGWDESDIRKHLYRNYDCVVLGLPDDRLDEKVNTELRNAQLHEFDLRNALDYCSEYHLEQIAQNISEFAPIVKRDKNEKVATVENIFG